MIEQRVIFISTADKWFDKHVVLAVSLVSAKVSAQRRYSLVNVIAKNTMFITA